MLKDAICNELRLELERFIKLTDQSDRNLPVQKAAIDRSRRKIEDLGARLDALQATQRSI